jgi:hypothetical protein
MNRSALYVESFGKPQDTKTLAVGETATTSEDDLHPGFLYEFTSTVPFKLAFGATATSSSHTVVSGTRMFIGTKEKISTIRAGDSDGVLTYSIISQRNVAELLS